MAFDAYDRSIQLLTVLVPLMRKLATCDPDLTKQLRRAGQSISLNLSEGNQRCGKDRRHLFRLALGSAAEVASALDIAVALDYLGEPDAAAARELLDRVRAMTYRLATK